MIYRYLINLSLDISHFIFHHDHEMTHSTSTISSLLHCGTATLFGAFCWVQSRCRRSWIADRENDLNYKYPTDGLLIVLLLIGSFCIGYSSSFPWYMLVNMSTIFLAIGMYITTKEVRNHSIQYRVLVIIVSIFDSLL